MRNRRGRQEFTNKLSLVSQQIDIIYRLQNIIRIMWTITQITMKLTLHKIYIRKQISEFLRRGIGVLYFFLSKSILFVQLITKYSQHNNMQGRTANNLIIKFYLRQIRNINNESGNNILINLIILPHKISNHGNIGQKSHKTQ